MEHETKMIDNNKETQSPINNKNTLKPFLKCEDFTVSKETFTLLKDVKSELLITHPQPELDKLSSYYESENYISHTDSKKTFFDRIYQKVKNYAIKNKVKLIQKTKNLKNKTETFANNILDIGCGTGDFLTACKNQNWNVVGVEPNKKARVLAKSKLEILTSNFNNFENQYPKIHETINSVEEQFDVITMWHVLEHVPNLEQYITQLNQMLKPNGTLIIAVPNHKSYDAKYYGKFWAAYDVPRHLWHFSQKSIKLLFAKENMKVIQTLPMKLDSFYVSLLSEKYKKGKSRPIKAFFVGLKSNMKALRTKEYSSLIYVLKKS